MRNISGVGSMTSVCRTDVGAQSEGLYCCPRIILRLRMLDRYLGASLMREGPCASGWAIAVPREE